jgi:type IV secretion system protein VirB9
VNRLAAFIAVPSLSVAACAGGAPAAPDAAYAAATLLGSSSSAATAPPNLPSAVAPSGSAQARARKSKLARRRAGHDRSRTPPIARVAAANRAAVREPDPDSYVGASQVYAWSEGALYRLYTAPEQVSDIALQPGETLVSVAAGDTARWVIGDTTSGAAGSRRTHILVKPSASDLRTNLVIATDRRVYHVELESTAEAAMPSISWTYPEDPLLALRGGRTASDPLVGATGLDTLNFGYRIEGDRPPWRPVRAFDDGQQVFIEFPAGFTNGEAPPLFVTGEGGRPELVNYRVRGRYYVVDRLFAAAELRLGERRQQVVRIVREDKRSGRSGRRP